MSQSRPLARLLEVPLIAALYVVSAKAGLSLAFVHKSITLVWPPTGIALAAFLLLGYRVWPGIALGAFVANLVTGASVASCLGITVGNTMEGVVGAWLVNCFARGKDAFARPINVLKFAALAAVLSTQVSASFGVGSLTLFHDAPVSKFGENWLTWWLGDAAGDLVVAPLLLLWIAGPRPPWGRLWEAACLALFLGVVTLGVFSGLTPLGRTHQPLQFLCIAPLVWVAIRFGACATSTAAAAVSGIAIWGTVSHQGPFGALPVNQALLLLQAFMGCCVVMGLALAAGVEEYRRSEAALSAQLEGRKRLEEQLLHSRKMESIALLAGGIAHDFNNLLNTILGYGELVLRALPPRHPATEDMKEIRKAAERGAKVTRQLLAFSRRQVIEPRILDLSVVVRGMEEMLGRLLGERIALDIRLAPEAATVRADEAQMEMVVMNLAINARDAMEGGGRLTIATAVRPLEEKDIAPDSGLTPGPHVELAVADTGCGMDEATQSRMFEPFFTTKERGKGTGLGLATVYGIVRQSNGQIRVTSAPGKGSTFVIDLPRVQGSVQAKTSSTGKKAPVAVSATVLLVEDEPSLLKLGQRVLLGAGYLVHPVSNAEEALALVEREGEKIDLLVTDVVMPGRNGRELADLLVGARPSLRVLYMSGYTDDELVRYGVREGMPFLQKPFTAETLLEKVYEVLQSAGG